MIEGMWAVVPDVRIEVSFSASDRWYKGAEAVYSADGRRLELWRPEASKKEPSRC
jgi:hypothetical protein